MTWSPAEAQIAAALAHAEACAPAECCGVIAGGRYHPLENRATDHDSFVMDMRGYVAIARDHKIEAIVHSHVDGRRIRPRPTAPICEKLGPAVADRVVADPVTGR